MSRYAKVDNRMWGDERFRSLSRPQPNAQTLFTYLLTGPHNLGPGCFEAGEYGLAEKLRWPIEGFRAAFVELEAADMVRADWDAQVVWIVKAIKHDPPANPNTLKHWLELLETVPECPIRTAFLDSLQPFIERFHEGLHQPSPNGRGNPSKNPMSTPEPEPIPEPSPELKPEPEPEPEKQTPRTRGREDAAVPNASYRLFARFCEESGTDEASIGPSERAKQMAHAKFMLTENTEDEVIACFGYLRSQSWRTGLIDLGTVKSEIGKWKISGSPPQERARASPSNGVHPVETFAAARDRENQGALDRVIPKIKEFNGGRGSISPGDAEPHGRLSARVHPDR